MTPSRMGTATSFSMMKSTTRRKSCWAGARRHIPHSSSRRIFSFMERRSLAVSRRPAQESRDQRVARVSLPYQQPVEHGHQRGSQQNQRPAQIHAGDQYRANRDAHYREYSSSRKTKHGGPRLLAPKYRQRCANQAVIQQPRHRGERRIPGKAAQQCQQPAQQGEGKNRNVRSTKSRDGWPRKWKGSRHSPPAQK